MNVIFMDPMGTVTLGSIGYVQDHDTSSVIFLSPEYISGNPCCKSDAWSLGMTLYELAEDKNPYRGSMTAVVTQRACDK